MSWLRMKLRNWLIPSKTLYAYEVAALVETQVANQMHRLYELKDNQTKQILTLMKSREVVENEMKSIVRETEYCNKKYRVLEETLKAIMTIDHNWNNLMYRINRLEKNAHTPVDIRGLLREILNEEDNKDSSVTETGL